jgi:DNA-binding MarR family transcriptional regulator
MTDPEIRRFAIEELMEARSRSRPASLTKAQYEMEAAFRRHVRQYVHFSESATQVAGLTPRQYQALLAIKGFPNREEITIGELAEQLQFAYRSAVGLVNRLVRQNLIARKQSGEDRREVYVVLTKRGAEILEQLVGTHQREIRRIGPRLEIVLESLMRDHMQ